MATRNRLDRGALIDRGANGSVGGSDVRIVAYLEGHTVDVGGLDGHRINDIPMTKFMIELVTLEAANVSRALMVNVIGNFVYTSIRPFFLRRNGYGGHMDIQ